MNNQTIAYAIGGTLIVGAVVMNAKAKANAAEQRKKLLLDINEELPTLCDEWVNYALNAVFDDSITLEEYCRVLQEKKDFIEVISKA